MPSPNVPTSTTCVEQPVYGGYTSVCYTFLVPSSTSIRSTYDTSVVISSTSQFTSTSTLTPPATSSSTYTTGDTDAATGTPSSSSEAGYLTTLVPGPNLGTSTMTLPSEYKSSIYSPGSTGITSHSTTSFSHSESSTGTSSTLPQTTSGYPASPAAASTSTLTLTPSVSSTSVSSTGGVNAVTGTSSTEGPSTTCISGGYDGEKICFTLDNPTPTSSATSSSATEDGYPTITPPSYDINERRDGKHLGATQGEVE
ncbi:hypothetical protein AAE478_004044 [Parahypoxylon ruwenzoriense]